MGSSYLFTTTKYRARCLKVVDGNTADLLVDLGFHDYRYERFRFYGINAPEIRSADPAVRELALKAKEQVAAWLLPQTSMDLKASPWPIRIETYKEPDAFGRWLALIRVVKEDCTELNINEELLRLGLAVKY